MGAECRYIREQRQKKINTNKRMYIMKKREREKALPELLTRAKRASFATYVDAYEMIDCEKVADVAAAWHDIH